MYFLNKIIWFFTNTVSIVIFGTLLGLFVVKFRRKTGTAIIAAVLCFLFFSSTKAFSVLVGWPLEKPFLQYESAEKSHSADAIVLLGGGISIEGRQIYPDMNDAADRVWHAARLFKCGKAPLVVVSGSNDLKAAVPLLLDLGVPRENIAVDNESRNTYENSRFTARLLGEKNKKRILLVTSAWHMRRARRNFLSAGLDVVPAPADFKACNVELRVQDYFFPSAAYLAHTDAFYKEYLGYFSRK